MSWVRKCQRGGFLTRSKGDRGNGCGETAMKISFRLVVSLMTAGVLALPAAAHAPVYARSGGQSSQSSQDRTSQPSGAGLVIAADGVKQIQQQLNRLGYPAGPINGKWDAQTQQAMRS